MRKLAVKLLQKLAWSKLVATQWIRVCGVLVFSGICPWIHSAEVPFSHFEGRQTHPIAMTPNGLQLVAAHTVDGRLSVFDISKPRQVTPLLIGEIRVGLEPVSVRARTDDEVWVVNEVSDSISIVSLGQRSVVATLSCPDEPSDVVFADGKAWVSCSRNNLIRIFDANTRADLGSLPVLGLSPRSLAVDASGTRLYAAFQMSGNGTTILPPSEAPEPPSPTNPSLPPAPQTALIVESSDPQIRFHLLDHDVAEISTTDRRVIRYFSGIGTSLFDLTFRPGTEELWVANSESLNRIRFEPNLKGHFVDHRLTRLQLTNSSTHSYDLNSGIDYSRLPNELARSNSLAQPSAIQFSSDGKFVWVAAFASDRLVKVDASSGKIESRIELRKDAMNRPTDDTRQMRGPRGLVFDEKNQIIYLLNRLSDTIIQIDATAERMIDEVSLGSHDSMPREVREGRKFLFDARLSGNGTASCGSCHIDADRDGLAWDLGDPQGEMSVVIGANLAVHDLEPRERSMHPMKGPMVTQTLRGMKPNQKFHWRGDRPTLAHFNSTFRDLMGGQLISEANIAALQTYLNSLRHHPNPNRRLDNTLPPTFAGGDTIRGQTLFRRHNNHCAVCHSLPSGSDNNVDDLRNIGTTQFMKTAPLQSLYQRAIFDPRAGATNVGGFGLVHDGTGGIHSLPTVHFSELDELVGRDFADVTAFLYCFDTGTTPSVGFNRTVDFEKRMDSNLLEEIAVVESQSQVPSTCSLIVHGSLASERRSFVFEEATRRYRSDRRSDPLRTRSELLGSMSPGDFLTFLGTLPEFGNRLGVDRDLDGTLDGDEPRQKLRISRSGKDWSLSWSGLGNDWFLESSTTFPGLWQSFALPHHLQNEPPELIVPYSSETQQFFQLRRTW